MPARDPAARARRRTAARSRPPRIPSSRSPAGLSRTTRPSPSTWTIRSVVPSTTAVSSCRSRSSASRSRAPWNATASSCRASGRSRGARPRRAARPSRPTGRAGSPVVRRRRRQPARHAARRPRHGRRPGRRGSPAAATAGRCRPRPCGAIAGPSASLNQMAPPSTAARRTAPSATERARSASDPPEATSWLSWYWAKSASASRWASSNARRLSRSSASIRARSVARRVRPRSIGRPPWRAQQEQDTRPRPDPDGRPSVHRGASRARGARRAAASSASHGARRGRRPSIARGSPPREGGARRSAAGASVSRIVLSPTAHRPRRASPSAAARASPRRQRVEGAPLAGAEPGLDARRPVERPRRAADRRDEPVADRAQHLAGRGLGGQLGQHLVDRSEADDEVVAVVPVAEDRIESCQLTLVARDDPPAAGEAGANGGGIDRWSVPGVRGGGAGDGAARRPRASRRPPECRRGPAPATAATPDRPSARLQRTS